MGEFTGERVIPGEVDPDLWNEHLARYLFASRLAQGRRVLDLGCGTGYGSAELHRTAASVTASDRSSEALARAARSYSGSARWVQAAAESLPFASDSFDLIVAFEILEHLENPGALLGECRRVLSPVGQVVISTPNRAYYAETRRAAGPNPFHHREFELQEFVDILQSFFQYSSVFTQNHTEAIAFERTSSAAGADTRDVVTVGAADAASSHFFVAVCALAAQDDPPSFFFLPRSGNVLRERETHIGRLEDELRTKDGWLVEARSQHALLVALHEEQTSELERSNQWAARVDADLRAAGERIAALQQELLADHEAAQAKIDELERENLAKTQWAFETEQRLGSELAGRSEELVRCVEALHDVEQTLTERTAWAQQLDARCAELERRIALASASRWLRLGRTVGLGPNLAEHR